MTAGRNRIGIISLAAAFAGFLFITFQPWLPLQTIGLFGTLSLRTLLAAFFDASLVGALADWFAVTALFRSPLGIKLPHTDILARNRIAIAEAVPRFLTGFVSEEKIANELGVFDFARQVERFLDEGAARDGINDFLRARLGSLLSNVVRPEGELSESLSALVREVIAFGAERIEPASAAGALIRWSQKEGVAERLIEAGAEALRTGIAANLDTLADIITPLVKKNAGWQGIFVGRGTIERLLRGAMEELSRFSDDPAHDLRIFLFRRLQDLSARLSGETPDPDPVRERVRAWFRAVLDDPSTVLQASRLLAAALERLRAAVQGEGAGFVRGAARVEEVLLSQLRANPMFRGSFNRGAAALVSSLITRTGLVEGVSGYLAGLLKNTDEREFVGRIEDAVWNDLQYIRVNGAVVGGMVGIVLAVFSSLVHP